MKNSGESRQLAEELARILEEIYRAKARQVDFDHQDLVTKIEAIHPLITTFARCNAELVMQGKYEEARAGIEVYASSFARCLDIPVEQSFWFCLTLVVYTITVRLTPHKSEPLSERPKIDQDWHDWHDWFHRLWERS